MWYVVVMLLCLLLAIRLCGRGQVTKYFWLFPIGVLCGAWLAMLIREVTSLYMFEYGFQEAYYLHQKNNNGK